MSEQMVEPRVDDRRAPASPAPEIEVDHRRFGVELTTAVEERLDEATLDRAHRRIQRKALIVGGWYASSYVLVLLASSWWMGILACTSLAVSMAAVGFNIQHDANHNALFRTRGTKRLSTPNRAVGWSMYALGGSAAQWIKGHVNAHHSAPNVVGRDDDIELAPFARLAPQQARHPWHRCQHLYLWALYCFTSVAIMVADVATAASQTRAGDRQGNRPSVADYTVLLGTKAAFVVAMVVVPLLLHPWWIVLLGIALTLALSGLLLGVVFQLAHAVEQADFRRSDERLECTWHEWQVRSTVDFCHGQGPAARMVTWYTGGLNYQTEHHLFPRVPHTAYPDIAVVVGEVCTKYDIPHTVQGTLREAVASHYRHLRRLGQA
ncbi:MAG TPA: acyl-CoA desaturase [Acidimicrobiales bacterium]